jgi:shikimate kinase
MPVDSDFCLLFLIGMPAAGKTFWGREIAGAHGWQFIDLDEYVAKREKASVPALFAQYGEAGFREREAQGLQQLLVNSSGSVVVACGGGTPCYKDNMQHMKDAGTVVYLQAGIPYLLRNLENSTEVRPLLKGRASLDVYLADLLAKRKKIYEQAHYILDAEALSLPTFAEIIASCTNRH